MEKCIHYTRAGSGKPLLMLHGWAMHCGVWHDLTADLADHYDVIAVDLRGHGRSASLPGPYTFTKFADDLRCLIGGLGLQNITAVGWSMGVAILLRLLLQPVPPIDSLVFISGTPSFVTRDDYPCGVPRAVVQRLHRQVSRSYPAGLENFYSLLFTEEERRLLQACTGAALAAAARQPPAQAAALESLQCLADEDLRPCLAHTTLPTLVIHGSQDRVCSPDAGRYMHEHITGSRLLCLPGAGHAPFITRRAAVSAALQTFLENRA